MGISRTLKDIAAYSDVEFKELSKSYRLLCLELNLKVPIIDPMKYIAKVANKANLRENQATSCRDNEQCFKKREIYW
jgi:transcription initiation factor TFIIB